jgi:arylsulfatase A-like enzyme
MQRAAALAALTPCIAVAAACGARDASRTSPGTVDNVVLVVADTLRADRLGCYGYPLGLTPSADRMAAKGTLFEHCYAQGCWTIPATIAIHSGLYVIGAESTLPAGHPALAEHLRAARLATVGLPGNGVLQTGRGFARGFARFDEPAGEVGMRELVRRLAEWHDGGGAAGARGFFAWLQPMDTHEPYAETDWSRAHPALLRPDAELLAPRWRAGADYVRERAPGAPEPAAAALAMLDASRRYDGEVAELDRGLGELLEWLDERGLRESTLLVLTADHGEALFEHGLFPELLLEREADGRLARDGLAAVFGNGHYGTFREEVWRVPLVVAGPGWPAGERRGGLAAGIDLYPTICAALGLAPPAGLAGVDLARGEPERQAVFAVGLRGRAVRTAAGQKLALHPRERFALAGGGPQPVELFDLTRDPAEAENQGGERATDVGTLINSIRDWQREHDRPFETRESEEMRAALEELGYAGGRASE